MLSITFCYYAQCHILYYYAERCHAEYLCYRYADSHNTSNGSLALSIITLSMTTLSIMLC